MSVNVDFDIRIRGFGDKQHAILQQATALLDEEGLLDDFKAPIASPHEIVFQSDFPVIISRSYEYLPELRERLSTIEKQGASVELKVSYPDDGAEWYVVGAITAAVAEPANKAPARVRSKGKAKKTAKKTAKKKSKR